MKKIVFFCFILVAALAIVFYTQNPATSHGRVEGPAKFTWEKKVHDFGKIKQGVPVTVEFKFTNSGDLPLQITEAKGSCGCTVPEWPKEPIMPGKSGSVKATFNAANAGQFNKTVSITANTEGGLETLTIKGEVIANATEGAGEIKAN